MAAPIYYTADMVRALPDDGNRYETVHGELLVTPAPRMWHQIVVERLRDVLRAYLRGCPEWQVFATASDISWGTPDVLVQPDLFVVPTAEVQTLDWSRLRGLELVVEVLGCLRLLARRAGRALRGGMDTRGIPPQSRAREGRMAAPGSRRAARAFACRVVPAGVSRVAEHLHLSHAFPSSIARWWNLWPPGGSGAGRGSRAGRRGRSFSVRPENGLLDFALTPPLRRHSDPEDRPYPGPCVTLQPGGSRHAPSPFLYSQSGAARCCCVRPRGTGGLRR